MNHLETKNSDLNHLTLADLLKIGLEIPTASLSIIRHLAMQETMSVPVAQTLLNASKSNLNQNESTRIGNDVVIESYIKSGFESDVFIFRSDTGRWVMKVGSNRRFSSGADIPSSADYAKKMRRNYTVLQSVYSPSLPYLIPQPYYVLHFDFQGQPFTTQLMPYIDFVENISSLSSGELHRLRRERLLFQGLSYRMRKNYLLQPDMIKPENLQVCFANEIPHLVLIDFGLFDLTAPMPVLNLLGYCALLMSFNKDIAKMMPKKR